MAARPEVVSEPPHSRARTSFEKSASVRLIFETSWLSSLAILRPCSWAFSVPPHF